MTFEKWQALGNDYVILEESELPFELTPQRVTKLCAPHTGVGSDGVLLLTHTDEPGFVAELRIFNPDGSEAEKSGNGLRIFSRYLYDQKKVTTAPFTADTPGGVMNDGRSGLPMAGAWPSSGGNVTGSIPSSR